MHRILLCLSVSPETDQRPTAGDVCSLISMDCDFFSLWNWKLSQPYPSGPGANIVSVLYLQW